MTLIVAGHNIENVNFAAFAMEARPDSTEPSQGQNPDIAVEPIQESPLDPTPSELQDPSEAQQEVQTPQVNNIFTNIDGVFFAADSSITDNGRQIVSGFKKVYEIPIRVLGVNILGGWFNGYTNAIYETACVVAFAGSTLVSQHLMNSIRNHLEELRPTYRNGTYQLALPCETGKHLIHGTYEDMFLPDDYGQNFLLTAPFVAGAVQHAIQAVLNKAATHNAMKVSFSAYKAEFILSIRCPDTQKYHIYQYEIVAGQPAGNATPAKVQMIQINEGDVAVIGMRNLFESPARVAFAAAIAANQRVDVAMLDFVSDAIQSQHDIGAFGIGFPAYLYDHKRDQLRRVNQRS